MGGGDGEIKILTFYERLSRQSFLKGSLLAIPLLFWVTQQIANPLIYHLYHSAHRSSSIIQEIHLSGKTLIVRVGSIEF
jgi:hypothetical protein